MSDLAIYRELSWSGGSDPVIPGYSHTTLFFVSGSKSFENHGRCEHFGVF
jgi:hypothetical protein